MGTEVPFTGDKAQPGRDAYHSPHLVPGSRMSRSYTSSPPSDSKACSGTALLYFKQISRPIRHAKENTFHREELFLQLYLSIKWQRTDSLQTEMATMNGQRGSSQPIASRHSTTWTMELWLITSWLGQIKAHFMYVVSCVRFFRAVFWVILPCEMIVDRSLGLLIPDDGGSTHLWNVGRQSFHTAV
jgi:hypothetical protein